MSSVDWKDFHRTDVWKVQMVDPLNLEISRGFLDNIESIEYTAGYYTETRSGASIKTFGEDGFETNSQLRIIHEVPEWKFSEVLFTGFVTDSSTTWYHGEKETTYTVSSDLYGLKVDAHDTDFVCSAGSTAVKSAALLLKQCSRPYKLKEGYSDYSFSSAKVFTVGDSILSTLSELCDLADCRYGVDSYGYVTISKYVSPSSKEPSTVLDESDERTLLLENQVQETSNESEMPGEVLVTSGDGDTKISGWAKVDSGSEFHSSRRGYNYVDVQEVSELNPNTAKAASAKAETILAKNSLTKEWSVESLYFPAECGDVYRYIGSGGDRNVMLKSLDVDCINGKQTMTLKGV